MNWEPGIVYMEYTQEGRSTVTMHRCWSVTRFKHGRMEDAAIATTKGKLSTVRFLTEAEYKRMGGK